MAFSAISTALIGSLKANVHVLWSTISANFSSHQSRLNSLETALVVFNTGDIIEYGGGSLPAGYLWCDAASYPRTAYPELYAEIGLAYTAVDDGVNFNVPDSKGRSFIGAGTGSGLTARSVGTKVGTETHVVSTSEMKAHTHAVTADTHNHGLPSSTSVGGAGGTVIAGAGVFSELATSSNTTGISLSNAGSGGAHNNVQPFLVNNFIIKT